MTIKRSRLLFWLLAGGLFVGLLAWAVWDQWFAGKAESPVKPPEVTEELQGIECLGRVDVEGGLLELSSLRTGQVVEVPVHAGMEVAAGTVLFRLDDRPAQLQVQQSQAGVQAAQAQLAQAEESARLHSTQVAVQEAVHQAAKRRVSAAQVETQRKQKLQAEALISAEDLTASRDLVEELQAAAQAEAKKLALLQQQNPTLQVDQARAAVARAQAMLAEAQYGLQQCAVRAPKAGRVLKVQTGPGQLAAPQKEAILFAPDRPRIVWAEVEQEFVHFVKVGQPALLRDEMNPTWSWPGQVTRIADWYSPPSIPQPLPRFTDVPTVQCLITLKPGHPPLRIGRRLTVLLGKTISSR